MKNQKEEPEYVILTLYLYVNILLFLENMSTLFFLITRNKRIHLVNKQKFPTTTVFVYFVDGSNRHLQHWVNILVFTIHEEITTLLISQTQTLRVVTQEKQNDTRLRPSYP